MFRVTLQRFDLATKLSRAVRIALTVDYRKEDLAPLNQTTVASSEIGDAVLAGCGNGSRMTRFGGWLVQLYFGLRGC